MLRADVDRDWCLCRMLISSHLITSQARLRGRRAQQQQRETAAAHSPAHRIQRTKLLLDRSVDQSSEWRPRISQGSPGQTSYRSVLPKSRCRGAFEFLGTLLTWHLALPPATLRRDAADPPLATTSFHRYLSRHPLPRPSFPRSIRVWTYWTYICTRAVWSWAVPSLLMLIARAGDVCLCLCATSCNGSVCIRSVSPLAPPSQSPTLTKLSQSTPQQQQHISSNEHHNTKPAAMDFLPAVPRDVPRQMYKTELTLSVGGGSRRGSASGDQAGRRKSLSALGFGGGGEKQSNGKQPESHTEGVWYWPCLVGATEVSCHRWSNYASVRRRVRLPESRRDRRRGVLCCCVLCVPTRLPRQQVATRGHAWRRGRMRGPSPSACKMVRNVSCGASRATACLLQRDDIPRSSERATASVAMRSRHSVPTRSARSDANTQQNLVILPQTKPANPMLTRSPKSKKSLSTKRHSTDLSQSQSQSTSPPKDGKGFMSGVRRLSTAVGGSKSPTHASSQPDDSAAGMGAGHGTGHGATGAIGGQEARRDSGAGLGGGYGEEDARETGWPGVVDGEALQAIVVPLSSISKANLDASSKDGSVVHVGVKSAVNGKSGTMAFSFGNDWIGGKG